MSNKAISGIKYWAQLLFLPIYWLSFLVPRNKKIWLFGSTFGRRFADNPRYFYLYVSQKVKDIRAIWISHDKDIVKFLNNNGYEAYYYHSFEGIKYCLIGGVYLFDNYSKDINFWLSGGAMKVNMWHGVGNKRINYHNKYDKVRHPKNRWEKFKTIPRRISDEKPSHYVLTTSPVISKIFASAFRIPMDHVIEAGYPRNDYLLGNDSFENIYLPVERNLIKLMDIWKKKGYKILLYIPTFRESEKKLISVLDLRNFNSFLQENKMMLVVKLHPKSVCRNEFDKVRYTNIITVSPEADVNSFLAKGDMLIADYSSVYSDFTLIRKPVVAFYYDFKEYINNIRDAYFDFSKYMPEVKTKDQKELEKAILKTFERDYAKEKRRNVSKMMFSVQDGRACERLACYLKGILKVG